MVETQSGERRMSGAFETVHFVAVYGTLSFLGILGIWLVVQAAEHGSSVGIRSFAGVLLPAVTASSVYLFNREMLDTLGRLGPGASFALSGLAGVAVMAVLRWFGEGSTVPVAELVVSACFSVLVFSSRALPEKHSLAYYYGVLFGMLVYVILLGFPL